MHSEQCRQVVADSQIALGDLRTGIAFPGLPLLGPEPLGAVVFMILK